MESSPKTSPVLPSAASSGGPCPALDELEAFLDQALTPADDSRLSQHLSSCGRCRELVESRLGDLLGATRLLADSVFAPPPAGRAQRPGEEACLSEDEFEAGLVPPVPLAVPSSAVSAGSRGHDAPPLNGRFELRRTLGIGGCGTVYEAWDLALRREVAVKVPHPGLFQQDAIRQRFSVEARAAARLSHPNIVPMFEAQISNDDVWYLVSELVRGPSLEEWMRLQRAAGNTIACRAAVEIVAELAEGVEFAHCAGVLHRDLKPSNVLLTPGRRGTLDFTPRITDFGLARLTEEATVTSVEGTILGSLKYMSPEQAVGRSDLGPGCDVYALGVILYELLTGQLPVNADGPAALLRAIPEQDVAPVRRHRPDADADVEAVCLKCLEKRPIDRYGTAGELAAELRRYLAGEPVRARLPTRRERAIRWVRRNPAASTIMATILLAGAALVTLQAVANQRQSVLIGEKDTLNQRFAGVNRELGAANARLTEALQTADDMRLQANRSRRLADEQRLRTLESLYVSDFRRAFEAWRDRDLLSLQRLLQQLERPDFGLFRGLECDWLAAQLARPHRDLLQFPHAAYTMVFAHRGDVLAAAGRDAVVKLVRYPDAAPVAEWSTRQREVNGLAFTSDDRLLWTSGDDGTLCQWDVATQRELRRIPAHAPEQAHDLLPISGSNLLASIGTDHRCLLWDLLTGESRGELKFTQAQAKAFELHPDGERLVVGTLEGAIVVWNLRDRTPQSWKLPIPGTLATMRLVQGGRRVLAVTEGRTVELCDLESGELVAATRYADEVSVLLNDDVSRTVYAVDRLGTVSELDLRTDAVEHPDSSVPELKLRPVMRLLGGRGYSAVLSPDQRELVTADHGGMIAGWPRAELGPLKAALTPPELGVSKNSYLVAGRSLIGSRRNLLFELNGETLQVLRRQDLSPREVENVKGLANGDLMLHERIESQEWLVRRNRDDWSVQREQALSDQMTGFATAERLGLAVSLYRTQNRLRLFGLDDLRELRPIPLGKGSHSDWAVSARSGRIAVHDDSRLNVFDLTQRGLVWTELMAHGTGEMRFSADGRLLAVADASRAIHVLRADSGRPVSQLQGHREAITGIAITADGRTAISSDSNGELRFWHIPNGEPLCEMTPRPGYRIRGLQLSPADDRLLVNYNDGALQSIPFSRGGR